MAPGEPPFAEATARQAIQAGKRHVGTVPDQPKRGVGEVVYSFDPRLQLYYKTGIFGDGLHDILNLFKPTSMKRILYYG